MNVGTTLHATAELHPQKTALIYGQRKISYGALDAMASRLARALFQKGVRTGSPVILMLHNSWEFVVSYFGIARLGAITVPIDVRLKGDELSSIISDSGASFLVVHQSLWEASQPVFEKYFLPGHTVLAADRDKAQEFSAIIDNEELRWNDAVDLSDAVDKNRDIHKSHERLHLLQASITDLPLRPESFDLVFCFGVIQHTPDPAATFRALVPFVKPGGRLAVDVYAAHPKQVLHWKYVLRPLAKRMPKDQLLDVIERATPPLLEVARTLRRVPKIGKMLTRLVPLKIHEGILNQFPLDVERKLAVLETFDAYSPAYDRPRSRRTVERWFREAGFTQIETFSLLRGLNYGRAIKPS